jgi:hypothetical protein
MPDPNEIRYPFLRYKILHNLHSDLRDYIKMALNNQRTTNQSRDSITSVSEHG